jgi:hypothetical protein
LTERPGEQFPEIVSADYLAETAAEIARLRNALERAHSNLIVMVMDLDVIRSFIAEVLVTPSAPPWRRRKSHD